jgi:hypothetical protein
MAENTGYTELSGGDVRLWINEGGVISLKVVTRHGDPVELNEDEAQELIATLQKLVAGIR